MAVRGSAVHKKLNPTL